MGQRITCIATTNIFYGTANRKKSEEDGCWCYLCGAHHNLSSRGVHFDKKFDLKLKQICQKEWMKKYGDEAEFIKRYGKSYLYSNETSES